MKTLKDKDFIKTLLKLAVPIAFQNLLASLLNIVDQVMVGALPVGVADNAMSAVLLVNQVIFIFQLVIFAMCNTANIHISQYWGKKDAKSIPPIVGFTIIFSMIVSILLTVFTIMFPQLLVGIFSPNNQIIFNYATDYLRIVAISIIPSTISIVLSFTLRALKKTTLSLVSNGIAIVLNGILNYCFMFGAFGIDGIGLMGAAWGTVISRIVECIIITVCVVVKKYPTIAPLKQMLSLDRQSKIEFIKRYFPILCNEIFWVLGTSVYLFVYGQQADSNNVLAAVNITQTISNMLGVVAIGIGSATSILIGNILGTGDNEKAKLYANSSMSLGLFLSLILAAIMVGMSFFAPNMFVNLSPESKRYATHLMILFGIATIPRMLNFIQMIGILRAGGDTTFCFVAETITIWLIAVPAVLVCGLVFKLSVEWLVAIVTFEEFIKVFVMRARVKTNKWVKNIADNTANLEETPIH